jgi:drug/metabolite transporter (DMT)-like permease
MFHFTAKGKPAPARSSVQRPASGAGCCFSGHNPRVHSHAGQLKRGIVLAGLAALLFGVTAPLLKHASEGVGTFFAGSLVYLGAALAAGLMAALRSSRDSAPSVPRGSRARIAVVALLGAVVAPALLVAGLRRTDGATASLLLALEAPFTIALARVSLREYVGARVGAAAVLITAGAAVLVGTSFTSSATLLGVGLVAAAALAWAFDNLGSRALADLDPLHVVAAKGFLGAAMSGIVAVATGDAAPTLAHAAALLLVGAFGYGVSLQLYLRAQHIVGAARTASMFATAPFFGVAVAFVAGAPWLGPAFPVAAVLVAAGVALHLAERHQHPHHHDALDHEHMHRHDDGHHDHVHDPMPLGPHSHRHTHAAVSHAHEHSEDLHHRHEHGSLPVPSPRPRGEG